MDFNTENSLASHAVIFQNPEFSSFAFKDVGLKKMERDDAFMELDMSSKLSFVKGVEFLFSFGTFFCLVSFF